MTTTALSSDSSSEVGAVRERHVLCVDDDPEFLKSLEFFLPDRTNASAPPGMWYRFLFFSRPQDALVALSDLIREGETVAMLISDQKMPSMKGTEFLAEAQRISDRCIRVLLTGYAGIESAILAINERLLDKYLTKPIEDQDGFAVSIQHLLQHFEMQVLVEQQSEIIGELYQFSNHLNASEDLDDTLAGIASFAGRVLRCEQAFVLVRDPDARLRSARIGLSAGVERWLDLPSAPTRATENGGSPVIRTVRSPTELLGEVWNVDEAIRQAPRFPMLMTALETDGEVLGTIGAAGRPVRQPFDGEAERTLSYIANTASIALRKLRARDRLKEAYRVMEEDARRLAEANRRLRTLDEARAEFLAFISHELATPLSLMSAVQMLGEAPDTSQPAPLIQGLRHGYEQLKKFVERGRTYFEWLSCAPSVSSEVTDMASLVKRAVAAAVIPSRDRIAFDPGPGQHFARIPEDAAWSIVTALVDNAIKFSGDDPHITIGLESSGERVTLTISDRGRGFPPGWANEVVRPFAVADTLHHHRGSGLSLATAAAIALAFCGSLEASSAGWDAGASFTVRLPGDQVPIAESVSLDIAESKNSTADPLPSDHASGDPERFAP